MAWQSVADMDVAGKRVLTRVDLNVPVEGGQVTDATRIERIVPTVRSIIDRGGRAILLAHFDRPKGKVVPAMSLRQVLPGAGGGAGPPGRLRRGLRGPRGRGGGRGDGATATCCCSRTRASTPRRRRTTRPSPPRMARLGRPLCNDAFSAAHRAHASTEGLARHLPPARAC